MGKLQNILKSVKLTERMEIIFLFISVSKFVDRVFNRFCMVTHSDLTSRTSTLLRKINMVKVANIDQSTSRVRFRDLE